jgi:hypothetical protein
MRVSRGSRYCRAGAFGEYVEDEVVAVEDPAFEFLLDVADLAGREFVVEDGNVGLVKFDIRADLGQFPLADVGPGIGIVEFLDEFFHRDAAGGLHQECQLFEVFLHRDEVLLVVGYADKDCGFNMGGGVVH